MYRGHWIHSLLYFEFVELTLFTNSYHLKLASKPNAMTKTSTVYAAKAMSPVRFSYINHTMLPYKINITMQDSHGISTTLFNRLKGLQEGLFTQAVLAVLVLHLAHKQNCLSRLEAAVTTERVGIVNGIVFQAQVGLYIVVPYVTVLAILAGQAHGIVYMSEPRIV